MTVHGVLMKELITAISNSFDVQIGFLECNGDIRVDYLESVVSASLFSELRNPFSNKLCCSISHLSIGFNHDEYAV